MAWLYFLYNLTTTVSLASVSITQWWTTSMVDITLRAFPANDGDPVCDKAGNDTLHQSVVPYYDVLLYRAGLVYLSCH